MSNPVQPPQQQQPYYYPQPKKSSGFKWLWIILVALLVFGIFFTGFAFIFLAKAFAPSGKSYKYETVGTGNGKIAVIKLDYDIYFSESLARQFKKYREDKSIKAILLHVNSPGGGVAASQEMYEEVKKTRDSGKPVVVSVESIGASGAYLASCGATLIVSNPGSLVGSIGVIMEIVSIKDMAEKLGIKSNTIKSGDLKDTGNPFRDLNEKDKEYLNDLVEDSYQQFLEVVSKERKIDMESLKKIANGRVFTGRQAMDLKLIDSIGTYYDALRIAAQLGKIEGEPSIVMEKPAPGIFEYLMENMSKIGFSGIKDLLKEEYLEQPMLQYKYVK